MATYRATADLGWNAAAANVNTQVANACNNLLQSGDVLILDGGLYKVSSRENKFKAGVTIRGADPTPTVPVNGFNCIGTASGSGQPFFEALGNITLEHVRFWASEAPETGFEGNNPGPYTDGHWHNGCFWEMYSGSARVINFCEFLGNLGQHLNVGGSGISIFGSLFHRSRYQVYCERTVTGLRLENNVFRDALIDGVKTINAGAVHRDWTVLRNVFELGRDGIDVAGGLVNLQSTENIYRALNVTAFDAKIGLDTGTTSADWNTRVVQDCVFTRDRFIDITNSIVLTLLNGGNFTLTNSILETYTPQRIHMVDCQVERTTARDPGSFIRPAFIKMGHHTSFQFKKIGWIDGLDEEMEVDNKVGTVDYPGWSHDNTWSSTGTQARRAYDSSVPFAFGVGGVAPPDDPVIPPAPQSAGEAFTISPAGLLTINRTLAGPLSAVPITPRATTPYGTASDTFLVTLD